jgi:hypothetical protein
MFPLVTADFLRRGSGRRVQLPIPLTPTREALIVLLDRFRSVDESGLQFAPNRANHECLATIVAHVPESVQQVVKNEAPNRVGEGFVRFTNVGVMSNAI